MRIVREATADDLNFIRDSFTKSIKDTCDMASGLVPDIIRQCIDLTVASDDWSAHVLCHDDTPDEILSAAIVNKANRQLLWLVTKPRYQRNGFGTELLSKLIPTPGKLFCVFRNPAVSYSAYKRGYHPCLRPYLVAEILCRG